MNQPGFDPSFENLACLVTLKSCDTMKQSVNVDDYIYFFSSTHIYIYIYIQLREEERERKNTTLKYMCVCRYLYTYTSIHIHKHIRTHTHTHAQDTLINIYKKVCRGQRFSQTINSNSTSIDTNPRIKKNNNPIKTIFTIKATQKTTIISHLKTTI